MTTEWAYVRTPGRGIDVDLGSEWPGFTEALADSVSSIAPRSSGDPGLSSHWIDKALRGLADAVDGRILASGNATEMVVHGDAVVARSLYEHFDDEHMDRASFVDLLEAWRAEVEKERRRADQQPG